MEKKINIYSFFIFFLFLLSMELWIGWGAYKSITFTVFGVLAVLCKFSLNVPWTCSLRNCVLCIAFFGGYYMVHPEFGLREFFTQIPPQLIPIISIVFLADKYKGLVMNNITKWYAWLMTISIFFYVLTMFVSIPNFGILSNGDRYGSFLNYIFYVKEFGRFETSIHRFGGPFLEPGYVGMMGAFLLFVNKFDLKRKEVQVILLSVLLSLSLAGWVLAFIGYFEIQYYKRNIRIKRLFPFACLFLTFILFGFFYNNGDNVINNEILCRLAFDEDKGFAGNNRNVETMMEFFQEMWGNWDLILYGYPPTAFYGLADWETIGAGLDRFMVFHGLMGVLYVFLFYIISLFYATDKKFALLFFIFILICFWQRTYSLWFSWIICFHYSVIMQGMRKQLNDN